MEGLKAEVGEAAGAEAAAEERTERLEVQKAEEARWKAAAKAAHKEPMADRQHPARALIRQEMRQGRRQKIEITVADP